eukprot:4404444-Prymnesium_polylepis.1
MLPMSACCNTCGENKYTHRKCRKAEVEGPEGEYKGIRKYWFHFKCVGCDADCAIKTDPKNIAYVVDRGVRRPNGEVARQWRRKARLAVTLMAWHARAAERAYAPGGIGFDAACQEWRHHQLMSLQASSSMVEAGGVDTD